MRVGDCRLLQVFLNTATTALEFCLHLDGDTGAMFGVLIEVVFCDPFNSTLVHHGITSLAGWNVNTGTSTI